MIPHGALRGAPGRALVGAALFLLPSLLLCHDAARAAERTSGQPVPAKGSSGSSAVPKGALGPRWEPGRLRFPPVGSIPEVAAERFRLPNGLTVYLVRDAEFPDLSGSLLMRAGTGYDPPELAGVGRIAAQVLRTGGTEKITGDSLDGRLEGIGARLETGADETSTNVNFYSLRRYGDEVLGLLADLVQHPAYPEAKLGLAKAQMRRAIASRNDEPGGIARRVVRQLVWGKDSPYYRDVEYATLEPIGTADLHAFHDRYYVPNHAILTVSGDLDPAAMKEQITRLFQDWRRSDAPLPPEPAAPPLGGDGGIYLVQKEQVTQSYVYLGQVGIKADNPDYPAMEVLGELLGGGFSSRIVNEIRTQRGLAYAAGAGAGVGYAHPGTFTAYALTRSDSTLVTLGLLRDQLRRIVTQAPTEEEVRRARESLLNSFVFNFQSRGQVVSRMAFYEFYGYPPDFLAVYQDRLRKVTPADVERVAREYLRPDQMRVLVIGDEKQFASPLASAGKVIPYDISIPGGPEGKKAGS